jgi:transposase-like protein
MCCVSVLPFGPDWPGRAGGDDWRGQDRRDTRRAYFEQGRTIKEIVRTLSVSRATVRKVIRGHRTEFKYERGVQPTPKLGDWVEVLTEILEKEGNLPKRERRSTQRMFEELRGRGYDGAHDSVHRFVKAWRDERGRCRLENLTLLWGAKPAMRHPYRIRTTVLWVRRHQNHLKFSLGMTVLWGALQRRIIRASNIT